MSHKDEYIRSRVTPEFKRVLRDYCNENSLAMSKYIKNLIIRDLKQKNIKIEQIKGQKT